MIILAARPSSEPETITFMTFTPLVERSALVNVDHMEMHLSTIIYHNCRC